MSIRNYPKGLWKQIARAILRVPHLVGLEWSLRICISNKFPRDLDEPHFEKHCSVDTVRSCSYWWCSNSSFLHNLCHVPLLCYSLPHWTTAYLFECNVSSSSLLASVWIIVPARGRKGTYFSHLRNKAAVNFKCFSHSCITDYWHSWGLEFAHYS